MAKIAKVESSAKLRLKQRTKGFQEREPYREALASLKRDDTIEVEPDAGETLRKIKLNLSRAAKDLGRSISYGETQENTVLVWLSDSDSAPRKRRTRRAKAAAAS